MGSKNGWRETTLGEEVDLLTGFPFKSRDYTDNADGIKLLRGDNVVQGDLRWGGVKRWPASDASRYLEYFLEAGDVVLAMDRPWIEAGLKYASISEHDKPCLLVQRVSRLRGGPRLDISFLRYLIGSREFTDHVLAVQTGTSVPHISPTQIKEFAFRCPPLSEQRRIAHILGTFDDKIELNRRMNRTLERMATAIFKSWFIDFDPVHAKAEGRDSGLPKEIANLFPESFEDSDLGLIPEGWEVKSIGDVADVNTRAIKKDYSHRRIQYVDISSVSQGQLDQTTSYDLAEAPSRAKRLVQTGDTIWSCVRPNRKAFLYIDQPPDNLVVSTGFAVLSPCTVPSSYLHQWVTTQSFVDYLTAYATGAAYPAVKADTFKSAKMVLPSESILNAFHDIVSPYRTRISHNQRENIVLAALRDTLLPKLLSGEFDESVLEQVEVA